MNPSPKAIESALDFVAARREVGLSDETMSILLFLGKQVGEPLSRKEVAEACGINVTSLPRYLTALVTSSHVEKVGSDRDGREVLFRISHHGQRLVGRLLKSFSPGLADAG